MAAAADQRAPNLCCRPYALILYPGLQRAMQLTRGAVLFGKLRSSRNAYRHGLSGPLWLDPETSAKGDALALAVAGKDAREDRKASAAEFARARAIRAERLAKVDLNDYNIEELQPASDRYECYACTKRRRAALNLLL